MPLMGERGRRMARQPWQPTDAEMERALVDLGTRLDYPAAPRLAEHVRARLRVPADGSRQLAGTMLEPVLPAGPLRLLVRRLAVALLALAVLAGTVLAVSPQTRTVVAKWLYLRGVTIFYTPKPPTPHPVGRRLGLGRPMTLAEARRRVPYHILLPAALGVLDEVYVGLPPANDHVTLVFRARRGLPRAPTTGVGLLLAELRGTPFMGKGLSLQTQTTLVTVNGSDGYWFSGKPHIFGYMDQNGMLRTEQARLAGNVLLWEQQGLTMRLEAAIPLQQALRIAASLR